jgi:hypothetical protein
VTYIVSRPGGCPLPGPVQDRRRCLPPVSLTDRWGRAAGAGRQAGRAVPADVARQQTAPFSRVRAAGAAAREIPTLPEIILRNARHPRLMINARCLKLPETVPAVVCVVYGRDVMTVDLISLSVRVSAVYVANAVNSSYRIGRVALQSIVKSGRQIHLS